MKRSIYILCSFIFILISGCGDSGSPGGGNSDAWRNQDKIFKLVVLHTNDIESAQEPEGSGAETAGGAAARGTFIKQARAEAEASGANVLLLDAGDSMYSSPLSLSTKGRSDIEIFDFLGYDALAIGNNDFNTNFVDEEEIRSILSDYNNLPFLSSNVFFKSDGALVGQAYIVKEFPDGLRVGIIGATTNMDASVLWDPNIIEVRDPVTETQKAVDELRANGNVDFIIVLSHNGTSTVPDAQRDIIARRVRNVDFVVEGHTPYIPTEEQWRNGKPVVIVDSTYVGKAELVIQNKEMQSLAWQAAELLLTDYPPDAETREFLCGLGSEDSCAVFDDTGADYFAEGDDLVILFTANTYGSLLPSYKDKKGGAAARATYISTQRFVAQKHPGTKVLLLDGGDIMYGDNSDDNLTSFVFSETLSREYSGTIDVEILKNLKYDAAVIGDRDFEFSSDYPLTTAATAATLNSMAGAAGNIFLAANITPSLSNISAYKVISLSGGYKAGVFGITDGRAYLTSADKTSAAAAAVSSLKAAGANKITALLHTTDSSVISDISAMPDVDVVINGAAESNANISDKVFSVESGRYVGRISFKEDGTFNDWKAQNTSTFTRDRNISSHVSGKFNNFQVSYACEELPQSKGLVRKNETPLGDSLSDALYYIATVRLGKSVDFSLTHGGMLYNKVPAGVVTRNTARNILRQPNEKEYLLSLTAEQFKDIVPAALINKWGAGGWGIFSYPVRADLYTLRQGSESAFEDKLQYTEWTFNGLTPEQLTNRTYYLTTNEYLSNGGDGYYIYFSTSAREALNYSGGDATAEYLKQMYYNEASYPNFAGKVIACPGDITKRGVTVRSLKDNRACFKPAAGSIPIANCSEDD
jgi:2',3'-cyclic-nucleotide 2'-phosphodiesterase (5'-nucleotidase family)